MGRVDKVIHSSHSLRFDFSTKKEWKRLQKCNRKNCTLPPILSDLATSEGEENDEGWMTGCLVDEGMKRKEQEYIVVNTKSAGWSDKRPLIIVVKNMKQATRERKRANETASLVYWLMLVFWGTSDRPSLLLFLCDFLSICPLSLHLSSFLLSFSTSSITEQYMCNWFFRTGEEWERKKGDEKVDDDDDDDEKKNIG